jgi:aspartyl-tRNA(Asn)/glutamyl-tRNA(Gln) amidotransferase subunit C
MALSLDEVKRIAALAHLRLTPEEELLYAEQLGRIVEYVDQLKAREGLEPGALPADEEGQEPSSTMGDVARPGLDRLVTLEAAPRSDGDFILVPRIHARPVKPGGQR